MFPKRRFTTPSFNQTDADSDKAARRPVGIVSFVKATLLFLGALTLVPLLHVVYISLFLPKLEADIEVQVCEHPLPGPIALTMESQQDGQEIVYYRSPDCGGPSSVFGGYASLEAPSEYVQEEDYAHIKQFVASVFTLYSLQLPRDVTNHERLSRIRSIALESWRSAIGPTIVDLIHPKSKRDKFRMSIQYSSGHAIVTFFSYEGDVKWQNQTPAGQICFVSIGFSPGVAYPGSGLMNTINYAPSSELRRGAEFVARTIADNANVRYCQTLSRMRRVPFASILPSNFTREFGGQDGWLAEGELFPAYLISQLDMAILGMHVWSQGDTFWRVW